MSIKDNLGLQKPPVNERDWNKFINELDLAVAAATTQSSSDATTSVLTADAVEELAFFMSDD